jgi:DtxR family Mn-dependent transcriptional regulator
VDQALVEDCLEAILMAENRERADCAGLARILRRNADEIEGAIRMLEKGAMVSVLADGSLILTPEGRSRAGDVARRHRVLESFLAEVLGMDRPRASGEACGLEHGVSDEMIDRLGKLTRKIRDGRSPAEAEEKTLTPLTELPEGKNLIISVIAGHHLGRLCDLGIIPGHQILLLRRLRGGAVTIRAKGCDIALSPDVAASIFGEEQ